MFLSAHGISLPPEFSDERMRKDLEAAAVAEWFNGYLGTHSSTPPSCPSD